MTAPIACGPLRPPASNGLRDEVAQLVVRQLRRQVGGDDLALGTLAVGEFGTVAGGERLRRLAPLLALARKHFQHLVVGQLTGLRRPTLPRW